MVLWLNFIALRVQDLVERISCLAGKWAFAEMLVFDFLSALANERKLLSEALDERVGAVLED